MRSHSCADRAGKHSSHSKGKERQSIVMACNPRLRGRDGLRTQRTPVPSHRLGPAASSTNAVIALGLRLAAIMWYPSVLVIGRCVIAEWCTCSGSGTGQAVPISGQEVPSSGTEIHSRDRLIEKHFGDRMKRKLNCISFIMVIYSLNLFMSFRFCQKRAKPSLLSTRKVLKDP
jgi:hypothetical protein